MSERYSRLFTLPENLYAIGSPVVIAAGTLLKDNQTGKIVAQLKLRSISDKSIRAVTVRLNLFDTAGNPIGNSVEYEYLDLNAARDLEFGQKNPVFVPESKARSYEASVVEVVFADRTTWVASCAEWEPLPKQKTLDAVLINAELIKQYKITVCGDVSYYPMEETDLWYCTCGALNHKDEHCHVCHRTLFELQAIDLARLAKDRDARIMEEFADEKARIADKKAAAEAAKKKTSNLLKIVIFAICAVIAIVLLINTVVIPNNKYNDAIALMDAGKYTDAIAAFEALDGYKDSVVKITECNTAILDGKYNDAIALMDAGKHMEAFTIFFRLDGYKDSEIYLQSLRNQIVVRETIGANYYHTVWLKVDGTVAAMGDNSYGQCDVSSWTEIVAISTGDSHTVGLKADGTVVATKCTGKNDHGRCDVSDWTDIVAISANQHTVGLKADGTVVAVGVDRYGMCDVSGWTDIVAISAGAWHTVGLKADGTVVAVGSNDNGQCDVDDWTDIVAISAGGLYTVGLKADGTVVAVGSNNRGQCDVSSWTDIVAISAGSIHTVGLKTDGTVVATKYTGRQDLGQYDLGQYNVSEWTNIVAIDAGDRHTVGLKADGTMVAVGDNSYGQCNVNGENDNNFSNSEDTETQTSQEHCIVCNKNAQYSYTNPFSGVAELYCYTHYREIKDTMSMMEEDVKNSYSGSSARHTDSEAFSCAKAIVKSVLKSPSTAKFCWITDATITHLGNGEYKVTGWVEAQNSFGATLRQNFVVVYTATENGYKNGTATLY